MDAGAHDRRIALRLALVLAAFLAIFHRGHFMSTDEAGSYFQTKSLSEDFSLAIPARVNLAFRGRAGRIYSQYVVGQSLLAVPFYALGDLLDPLLTPGARRTLAGPIGALSWAGEPPVGSGAFSVLFFPPVAAGALAALFFLFERRLGASRRAALAASLALAIGTHAALMSTLLLQHTTEALCALGAFFFWHRYRESGATRDVLLGSACAAAIFNVRAAGALNGVALGGYLLFVLAERALPKPTQQERGTAKLARTLAAAVLPVIASAAFYALMNWLKWGSWLESPQLAERSTLGNDPRAALLGFLASPGMSVFLYTPLLLLAPLTLARFWRTRRAEALTLLALFATTLAFYSTYQLWTGLFSCPGPRYLFTAMVFLMLPLGPWLDANRSFAARAAFGVLALCGAAVQLISTTVSWGRLIAVQNYEPWLPRFGFVFDWNAAPLIAAARRVLDPVFADVWVARTALGWAGQPAKPALAAVIVAIWALGVVLLARRLRAAFAGAAGAESRANS